MISLKQLKSPQKFLLSVYLLLSIIGFSVAALMSYERYQFDHQKTVEYYLGNPEEGEAAFQKPLGHLVQATHVHAFMMPVIFLVMWALFSLLPLHKTIQYLIYLGGTLSILSYNAASYLVRFVSEKWVWVFTAAGIGLFFFYILPTLLILFELSFGFKEKKESL